MVNDSVHLSAKKRSICRLLQQLRQAELLILSKPVENKTKFHHVKLNLNPYQIGVNYQGPLTTY